MEFLIIGAVLLGALYVVVKVAHRRAQDRRERHPMDDIEQQIASLRRSMPAVPTRRHRRR